MSDSTILNTITSNGVTSTASTSTSKSTSTSGSSLDKNAFLQLLCTQMQYQDPLDPQDNSQYLAQLAQFSSLEQMTNVATAMSKLSTIVDNLDTSMLVGQLSGMIGKEIQWTETTTVKDANGNAVTDDKGNTQTKTTSYEGKATGVSISNGVPTIIATTTVNGQSVVASVPISELTRIGSVTTSSTTA